MKAKLRHLLLFTATAFVLVPGCGSGPRQHSRPPARALVAAESDRLYQGEEILIGRCMAAQGFTYTVLRQAPPPEIPDFPYGIDDVAWASQHGYGLADRARLAEAQQNNPNARYVASLSSARQAAYDVAVYGTRRHQIAVVVPAGQRVTQSVDGCLAHAEGQLYGDFPRWFRAQTITENLLPAIQPKVFGDARYRQALQAWSACASAVGHPAASPDELRSQVGDGGATLERGLAVTDATCNRHVRLADVGHALDQELGAPIRARYQVEMETYARMRLGALRRAISVLNGKL